MANSNPVKARQTKARKRMLAHKAGDLTALRTSLWRSIAEVVSRVNPDTETEDLAKLVNTLCRSASAYLQIFEAEEIVGRLKLLEQHKDYLASSTASNRRV